nr:hypothetical protein [Tanacetum cinerariifolium]
MVKHLVFDFKTFVQTTRLDYNNGQYEALPQTEFIKAEIPKLGLHIERNVEESASVLVNKTLLLKTWFPVDWRILMTFVIQVLGGNKYSIDQVDLSQHIIVYGLFTGAKIDIYDIIFNDLVNMLTEKPRKKYVAYPRFLSCVLKSLLGSNYAQDVTLGSTPSVLSKFNFHQNSFDVPPIELTEYMLSVVNHQASVSHTPSLEKVEKRKRPHKSRLVSSGHTIDPQDTKRHIQFTFKGLPISSPKDGTRKSQLLPDGKLPDPKDSWGNKQPIDTRLLSTTKDGIHQSKSLLKGKPTDPQEETITDPKDLGRNIKLTDRGFPSTNVVDQSGVVTKYQVAKDNWENHEEADGSYVDLKWEVKAFHEKTFRVASNTDANLRYFEKLLHQDKAQHVEGINKILTNLKELQDVVKDNPIMNANVLEGLRNNLEAIQNTLNAHHEELAGSYRSLAWNVGLRTSFLDPLRECATLRDQEDMVTVEPKEEKITKEEPQGAQLTAQPITEASGSSFMTPRVDKGKGIAAETDPSLPKRVKTSREVQMDPNAPVLINWESDGKIIQITNDELHEILDKKEHIEQAMKEAELELSKPKIMKVVAKVFNKAKFGDFGLSEWDELSVIIPKKKNKVVCKLLTSLRNKYERLKKIPSSLRLNLALPLPKQDPSLLKHKRKAMEQEPEIYIAGLHCNRKLLEGFPFEKNLVIEQPEHGIFFIDAFGKPAFQRVDVMVLSCSQMGVSCLKDKGEGFQPERLAQVLW